MVLYLFPVCTLLKQQIFFAIFWSVTSLSETVVASPPTLSLNMEDLSPVTSLMNPHSKKGWPFYLGCEPPHTVSAKLDRSHRAPLAYTDPTPNIFDVKQLHLKCKRLLRTLRL
jgi:hypothetical protein